MEVLESSEKIIGRLLDPGCERTDKFVARAVKNAYLEHLLQANWRGICGENLANHCCIHKLEKDVLTVRTESSVWANHLLMMKNLFLQKINMFLLNRLIIKDLRFYSGGVIDRYESRIRTENEPQTEISTCRKCGVTVRDSSSLCSVCRREEKAELGKKIAELVKIQPWLTYEECLKYCKCDRILFTAVKDNVKNIYFEKVRLGHASKSDCLMAVMFLTGKRPEEIEEKTYANTLEFLRRDQSVSTPGIRLYGKKQRNHSNF